MIVHIGLGKTGTTSLQKEVFPELKKMGLIDEYNPQHLMGELRQYIHTGRGKEFLKNSFERLPEKTLISVESLAGWNPAIWDFNLKQNVAIFPKNTTILITLRDPESYLTSVYIQMLQTGNVIKPEQFLLNDIDYEHMEPITRPHLCEIFKVDDLNYEKLVNLYSTNFHKLVVVPISGLSSLNFITELCDIAPNQLDELRIKLSKAKRENISYSKSAIRLTFLREKMLSLLGIKMKSSLENIYDKYSSKLNVPNEYKTGNTKFSTAISLYAKANVWRYVMQKGVDKLLRYRKYSLPSTIHRGYNFQKNQEYYSKLVNTKVQYLAFWGKDSKLQHNDLAE